MSPPNDKEAFRTWAQEVMRTMASHLANHAVVTKDEIKLEARWNYPFRILLAQAWGSREPDRRFWVVGGDVPIDHAEARFATDPRAALKYFALRWQMQGARVKSGDRDLAPGKERSKLRLDWSEIGDSIAEKAEFVYALAEDDRNWESTMRM